MNLKEALYRSILEIFAMIDLQPELKQEVEEHSLTSASEINALVGFNYVIKGNVVLALDKQAALKITAAMTGTDPGQDAAKVKSAIGDMAKLVTDLALGKMKISSAIYFTPPPTLITGEDVFLLISRTRSERLKFEINGGAEFSIAYSLD